MKENEKKERTHLPAQEVAQMYREQFLPEIKELQAGIWKEMVSLGLTRQDGEWTFPKTTGEAGALRRTAVRNFIKSQDAYRRATRFTEDLEMLGTDIVEFKRGTLGALIPANPTEFRSQRMNVIFSGREVSVRAPLAVEALEREVIGKELAKAEEYLRFQKGDLDIQDAKFVTRADLLRDIDDPGHLSKRYDEAVSRVVEASELSQTLRSLGDGQAELKFDSTRRQLVLAKEPDRFREKDYSNEIPSGLTVQ